MKKLMGLVAAGAALLWASAAGASTITVGLQEAGVNSGNITTVDTVSTPAVAVSSTPYGTFSSVSVTGEGSPPLAGYTPFPPWVGVLDSNTIDVVSGTKGGTLYVYVSDVGIAASPEWLSGFTVNDLPTGWTVNEYTYLGPAAYSTAYLLNFSPTWTGPIGGGFFPPAGSGSTDPGQNYSVATELFVISASGIGNANLTIDLSNEVPIPAALPLFAGGLGLLGFAGLRRRRKAAA